MRVSTSRRWLALALAGALSACASGVRLTNAWLSPGFGGPPFHKILVLGPAADGTTRRLFEDSFAAALASAGVQAVPAYTLLPAQNSPAPEALQAAARQAGADAVLATQLLRVEQRTEITPGYVRGVPVWGYRGGFYGYYGAYRAAYVTPPRVTTTDVGELQTDLWSLRGGGGVVWSATSQALAPTNAARVGSGLAASVAQELQSAGLISPPSP